MILRSVTCDRESFRPVSFEPGFNLVLADQTDTSSEKDTRNGSGKSLLVEIIHFCLGSDFGKTNQLRKEALKGVRFTLTLEFREGGQYRVSRDTARPKVVGVSGDTSGWRLKPDFNAETGQFEMAVDNWTAQLGLLCFDLPIQAEKRNYVPTFRPLISYFIRSGRDAFATPFENHKHTSEGDKQIFNAFLLGINWELARQFQLLKDHKKLLDSLRSAAKQGLVEGFFGTIGELQAEKVRLEDEARRTEANLNSFLVHPEYERVERQANLLTRQIHDFSNQNVADRDFLAMYEASLQSEQEPALSDVEAMYAEAGVVLPDAVRKRFEDVAAFHRQLTDNRRQYLTAEIDRLKRQIADRNALIQEQTAERAQFLDILRTHGALAEYTRLQQLHLQMVARIQDLERRIGNLRSFEEGRNKYKIDLANLEQTTRLDLNERATIRDEAIRLFNANSEALYDAPGRLAIDVDDTGYDFQVDIEREGSEGIDSMKIFCYDLMLAQLWAARDPSPRVLVHDSTLFDGVDERQKAHALRLAERESRERGFQYITLLNTDSLPSNPLIDEFDTRQFVRITLTDQEDGCLMGFRF